MDPSILKDRMKRLGLVVVMVVMSLLGVEPVLGAIESCSVSVSPTSMAPEITGAILTFSVTNSGSSPANWIKVIWTPAYYTVTNFDVGGWPASGSLDAGWYTFLGGSIVPVGANFSIQFEVTSAVTPVSNTNWTVQLSDDNGATAIGCSGNLEVPIVAVSTATPTPTPTTSTTTTTTTTTTTKTVEKIVKDTTLPATSLTTSFKKVYAQAPEIAGKASDASGVARVEYTLDGKNWLPVDSIDKQFGKRVSFSFLPGGLLDGNYPVKVRVMDAAGNVGFSSTYTLVIDRLPPRVGLAMWSAGPLVIEPTVLEGMKLRVSLSAVGGPTEIKLNGSDLIKDEETGLWTGEVKFDKADDYKITAAAVDGADNRSEGELGVVRVMPAGMLPAGGTVTVYYFEPTGGHFREWDGRPFDQVNPQQVNEQGKYLLMLPPGKYYLEATGTGFRKARTEIFTLDKTTPVNMNFELKKKTWWPWEVENMAWKPVEQAPEVVELPASLPFFALPSDNGELIYSSSLRGVPTVVTFLSSWVPTAAEQVTELEKVTSNKNYKAVAVFAQQPQSLVEIFKKRGGYSLTMIADADGELLEPLDISSVPTHIFLDRKGKIVNMVRGVLGEAEIYDMLNR